jgi:phage gp36-like protein
MAWTTLNAAAVATRLTGPELAALQSAALADGQTDPLPEIVTQVVDEVRGYVAAGGITLGAAGTVPSKLVSAALAIIRYRLATRLPIKSLLTDTRIQENRDAIQLLQRVADGKFLVEEPTETDTESSSAPSPSFGDRTLNYERADQDGI